MGSHWQAFLLTFLASNNSGPFFWVYNSLCDFTWSHNFKYLWASFSTFLWHSLQFHSDFLPFFFLSGGESGSIKFNANILFISPLSNITLHEKEQPASLSELQKMNKLETRQPLITDTSELFARFQSPPRKSNHSNLYEFKINWDGSE